MGRAFVALVSSRLLIRRRPRQGVPPSRVIVPRSCLCSHVASGPCCVYTFVEVHCIRPSPRLDGTDPLGPQALPTSDLTPLRACDAASLRHTTRHDLAPQGRTRVPVTARALPEPLAFAGDCGSDRYGGPGSGPPWPGVVSPRLQACVLTLTRRLRHSSSTGVRQQARAAQRRAEENRIRESELLNARKAYFEERKHAAARQRAVFKPTG